MTLSVAPPYADPLESAPSPDAIEAHPVLIGAEVGA
jgi:hypothetical protein